MSKKQSNITLDNAWTRLAEATKRLRELKSEIRYEDYAEPETADALWRSADAAQLEIQNAWNIVELLNKPAA